jgi:CRISPR system Cascade subunit CasE
MTTPPALTMLQLAPDPFRCSAWMAANKVARSGFDDGYGWHALLAAAFGSHAPKPFRVIEHKGGLQLLGYTTHAIDDLRDHAQTYAEPAVAAALRLDDLAHKPMPTTFRTGQRLGFEIRLRPTVRQDRDENRKLSREVDAFLAAVTRAGPREDRDDLDRRTVYRDWLATRLAPAATLVSDPVITQLRRTMLLRRGLTPRRSRNAGVPPNPTRALHHVGLLERGQKGDQGGSPDAVFHGELTVTDPIAFQALLARGVGRHRSFGFGMLLLRPTRRR